MPTISLTRSPAASIDGDVLVVGLRPTDVGVSVVGLSREERDTTHALEAAFAAIGAAATPGAVALVPGGTAVAARTVLGVGLGPSARGGSRPHRAEQIRRAAGAALRAVPPTASVVVVALPTTGADQLAAAALGAQLGAYRYERFRSPEPARDSDLDVRIVATTLDRAVRSAVDHALAVGAEVLRARDLVNTPPSHLSPEDFASAAVAAAESAGLEVEVLDEAALAVQGYGGIVGVGQGSANPPRLVRIAYRPRGAKKHLALVGKGVTFDSGGLSLKPPQAMETMKCDMAGAAAVLGATLALAATRAKVDVTAYLPLVENMPSGTAQRPGDVLTMLSGATVEVLNTDAEGRLILADGLTRAQQDHPDVLIDVATLTGAAMVALGVFVAGAMGNDDSTRGAVVAAAEAAGEQMWAMPLPDELRPSLDSPVADIKNIGDRYGGMLTAGLFLQHFVDDDQRWVHLDIAGPSFNEGSPHGYTGKGGTGYGIRTLVEYGHRLAATNTSR